MKSKIKWRKQDNNYSALIELGIGKMRLDLMLMGSGKYMAFIGMSQERERFPPSFWKGEFTTIPEAELDILNVINSMRNRLGAFIEKCD